MFVIYTLLFVFKLASIRAAQCLAEYTCTLNILRGQHWYQAVSQKKRHSQVKYV